MTTPVVTVSLRTPCKRIAALLAQHQISAVPALTVHPDAPLPAAAGLMTSRHVKRLPVTEAGTAFGGGAGGKLIGIVSRRDLLRVFLRPDADIAGGATASGVSAEVACGRRPGHRRG
jgi:CBS-domain-containing membrane protein